MPRLLTAEEIELFRRDGYIMVPDLLDDSDLQPAIDEIATEIDVRAAEMVARGDLSRTYEEFGFEIRLAKISEETDKIALGIWNGTLSGPAFFYLITNP